MEFRFFQKTKAVVASLKVLGNYAKVKIMKIAEISKGVLY